MCVGGGGEIERKCVCMYVCNRSLCDVCTCMCVLCVCMCVCLRLRWNVIFVKFHKYQIECKYVNTNVHLFMHLISYIDNLYSYLVFLHLTFKTKFLFQDN